MSGAASLTWKVAAVPGCSRATRCDPTPIARPNSCAAIARFLLTSCASSNPPVIEEMRSGARRDFPRKVVLASISAIAISGSALWTKAYRSNTPPEGYGPPPASRHSSRCSFFRSCVGERKFFFFPAGITRREHSAWFFQGRFAWKRRRGGLGPNRARGAEPGRSCRTQLLRRRRRDRFGMPSELLVAPALEQIHINAELIQNSSHCLVDHVVKRFRPMIKGGYGR